MHRQRGLWLFLVPSFGLMALVLLWPLAYAVYLSTFDYYLGSKEMRFVGLANYAQLLSEARLWQSLWTTIVIALGSVGLEFSSVLFSRLRFTGSRSACACSYPAVLAAHHQACRGDVLSEMDFDMNWGRTTRH